MGLKLVPENESVYFIEKGAVDDWGIASAGENKIRYGCTIKGAEDLTPVSSIGGKQIIPSFNISFNGKVPFTVGDYVEVEGLKKIILSKKESKDISRKVLISKITV